MRRCARHNLFGCALCGADGKGVVSATPAREHAKRDVHVYDFDLARLEEAVQAKYGRSLTPEERTTWLAHKLSERALRDAPAYDILDPEAVLRADALDPKTRGRVYQVRGDSAHCPDCGARVECANFVAVSGYAVQLPNFAKCDGCRHAEEPGCDLCDGKGYVISSWTRATAYLRCAACVARLRQPTRRGSATNFTTTSRAGEEYGRKAASARPMCTACQQRSATTKGARKDDPLECRECRASRLHREARALQDEISRLKADLGMEVPK